MAEDESGARGARPADAPELAQVSVDAIALAASDPTFRTLAAAMSDNLILLDREGRVRYINYTVPDLSVDRVIGTLVYEYVPVEYREVMRRCHERVLETGQPARYETTYVSADGDASLWESRVSPVVRDGVVVGLVQLASNVTERRQAAADRDRMFNLSIDMLCVAGLDGYLKRVNPAFEQTLGHAESELLASPFLEFVHPEDRDRTRDAVVRLGQGEVVLDFENRYRCRDGSYRWISWRASTDAGGRQVVAVGRDVTQRRALEQTLRESQKLQAVGQLAGGIAHDFNNLVLAIDLNAQLARVAKDEATRIDNLDEIARAAKRAADLTRQLLAFARRQAPTLVPVDLNLALEGMTSMLRRLIPESIEIRLRPAQGIAPVLADAAQLEQVVMNLCLNARDAMPGGGALTLETGGDADFVWLRVQDTGTGIAPEVREHIFEPFFTTKPQGLGTGLGLATVYGIVEQHRGRIRVESELGRGSAFVVELPASRALLAARARREAPNPARARGSETVLVAEDEPGVRRAILGILAQAGYGVLVANDGEEALEVFERHCDEVDLLLFDVVMPRLNGPAAVQRIRQRRPEIPVVFMSGHSADLDPTLASIPRSRRTDKPFAAAALLTVLREALEEAP